jgi:DNA replication protein DnaC
MTTNHDRLAEQLRAIGLKDTAEALDELLRQAARDQWSADRILAGIVEVENKGKVHRSLERRLKRSQIRAFRPMADFDWSWPNEIDRPLIEACLDLDFVLEGRNLILLGSNGLGKTMIAKNIAYAAVLAGHSVSFRTAAEMLRDVDVDSPELRRRRIRKYIRPQLLAIDEVGYLSYDDHAADLLYQIINPRYEERRSTIVTTNLAFKDWNVVFPNATCIATLLDRLTHHADITQITGDTYRGKESEEERTARRRRRTRKKKEPGEKDPKKR